MSKRFLNVQYCGRKTEINVTDAEGLGEIRTKIKESFGDGGGGEVFRCLYSTTKKTSLLQKHIPAEYYEVDGDSYLDIRIESNTNKKKVGARLVGICQETKTGWYSWEWFKIFDQILSFQILAECLSTRYLFWLDHSEGNHPIPFVADGPGAGKSRFLQEISGSFKEYVKNSKSNIHAV